MAKGVEISAVVLLCVAIVLSIVDLAIPEWLYVIGGKMGTFRFCEPRSCNYYIELGPASKYKLSFECQIKNRTAAKA